MKKFCCFRAAAIASVLMFCSVSHAGWQITQITHNAYYDAYPQINNSGHIVWQGADGPDYEIFYWNGTGITKLSNNNFDDGSPQINNNDQIVWYGSDGTDYEIFFRTGTSIIQLTNNEDADLAPQLNNSGRVVWQEMDNAGTVPDYDYEIYYWNGTSVIRITNNNFDDLGPRISDNGSIVWQGDSGIDSEIYYWNGSTTTQLTRNKEADGAPQINSLGRVVWQGSDGTDNEIYYWNSSSTTNISNNSTSDALPQINDSGQITWYGDEGNGTDNEIYFWQESSKTKITNNSVLDISPQINNRGEVVWEQYDGNDYEIYYWNGTAVTRITNNTGNDYAPRLNDSGQIVWYGSDGTDYEIFIAQNISDSDGDGVLDAQDNCPSVSNGPNLGTCLLGSDKAGGTCVSDADCVAGCSSNGYCSMNQEDSDADGVGDACDIDSKIKALVREYYLDILGREPDASGWNYWTNEITRIMSLGIYVGEGFQAEARFFFNSSEYLNKNTSATVFVTDLYHTFLQREPDTAGLTYWVGQLACLTRNMLITQFAYSNEFKQFMTNTFGADTTRPENNLINDFYRGFLSRFPDAVGFNGYLTQMRDAQCTSADAVKNLSYQIALSFVQSSEYAARNRNNTGYVEDLYNGILRRGADCAGFTAWVSSLNAGTSRASILKSFTDSAEFQTRVNAVIAAGCLP